MKPYYKRLEERLLEHRYRYYVLNHPILEDHQYDWIEKLYIEECRKAGEPSILENSGVGFSEEIIAFKEAAERVIAGTDSYSLWEKEMKPIWDKIGPPKYMKDQNDPED